LADSIQASSFEIIADPEKRIENSNLFLLEIIKMPVYAKDIHFSPSAVEYYLIDYD